MASEIQEEKKLNSFFLWMTFIVLHFLEYFISKTPVNIIHFIEKQQCMYNTSVFFLAALVHFSLVLSINDKLIKNRISLCSKTKYTFIQDTFS